MDIINHLKYDIYIQRNSHSLKQHPALWQQFNIKIKHESFVAFIITAATAKLLHWPRIYLATMHHHRSRRHRSNCGRYRPWSSPTSSTSGKKRTKTGIHFWTASITRSTTKKDDKLIEKQQKTTIVENAGGGGNMARDSSQKRN